MPRPQGTPRAIHRRQISDPKTPQPEKQRLNGLLKDGLVYCNCEPRAEARLFETKKEGPNKGKWFYRCARSGSFKCDLFLWESEAADREAGLTPAQKREADKEVVVHGPTKTPKSQKTQAVTPRMTQRSLAAFGYTKQRRGSEESSSDSERVNKGEAVNATKGKRKLDVFESDSDGEAFGTFNSEDEEDLAAMADEAAEKAEKTPVQTKVVAGLPTPSTTRTLFPEAGERSAKRQRVDFDDLPETPSKPSTSSTTGTASTKTVSFSSPPPSSDPSPANPVDTMLSILAPYNLSPADTEKLKNLLVVETRKRVGAEKSRDFKQKRTEALDGRIAKLQAELAASKNKESRMHGQITEMKARVMRHYQDFGNI